MNEDSALKVAFVQFPLMPSLKMVKHHMKDAIISCLIQLDVLQSTLFVIVHRWIIHFLFQPTDEKYFLILVYHQIIASKLPLPMSKRKFLLIKNYTRLGAKLRALIMLLMLLEERFCA